MENGSFPGPSEEEVEFDLYELSWIELLIWCVLYSIIALMAVVGNSLVIWVTLVRLRSRSITTYFIINLAFADLLTGILAIPFKFQAALFQEWFLPWCLCQMVPYAETVSLSVSVFTLTASAIHEFRTVFFPKHGRLTANNARSLVMMIWFVAAVVSLPHGLFHKVYTYEEPNNVTIAQCRPVYAEEGWWKMYNIYLVIIHYFVPMLILDTAYTLIAIKVWTTTVTSLKADSELNRAIVGCTVSRVPVADGVEGEEEEGEPMPMGKGIRAALREMAVLPSKFAERNATIRREYNFNVEMTNNKLMKMLMIVVACFSLCWFPLETYLLINEVKPQINEWRYINVFFFCSHWLAMSNSCLNPIIYGLYNEKYQREYKQVWNRLRCVIRSQSGTDTPQAHKFHTEYEPCAKEVTDYGTNQVPSSCSVVDDDCVLSPVFV